VKNLKFNIKELDRVIFEETKAGVKRSWQSYEEEDSY